MDPRWNDLANIIVHNSTQVKPGERVMISMRETHTFPLVQALYQTCIQAGAHVQIQFLSDVLDRILLTYGSPEQINQLPEIEAYGMEWADVYIGVRGAHNLYELAAIPDDVLAQNRKVKGAISSLRWEKTRWIIISVPNEDFAQQAEADYETVMEMFFKACLHDHSSDMQRWEAIVARLNEGRELRLVASGTDLRFSLVGRRWKISDASRNMPGGEILTSPDENSVNGYITFDYPGVLGGRLVQGIRLEWKDGDLIRARASQNEAYLLKIVTTDGGASKIGEFAFGINDGIDRFCKDIFFDEKIGGTVHIALGRAYPEVGGRNQSTIHWDIIKDLRQEGKITLDGKLIFEKGKFLI